MISHLCSTLAGLQLLNEWSLNVALAPTVLRLVLNSDQRHRAYCMFVKLWNG